VKCSWNVFRIPAPKESMTVEFFSSDVGNQSVFCDKTSESCHIRYIGRTRTPRNVRHLWVVTHVSKIYRKKQVCYSDRNYLILQMICLCFGFWSISIKISTVISLLIGPQYHRKHLNLILANSMLENNGNLWLLLINTRENNLISIVHHLMFSN